MPHMAPSLLVAGHVTPVSRTPGVGRPVPYRAGMPDPAAADPDEEARHAWERPGAHPVAPGIHRIPLPLPGDSLKAVNVYAVADGDELVLVDGGWALAEAEQLLGQALAEIGYELGNV